MKLLKILLLCVTCLLAGPACAAITCSTLSSTGWTTGYVNGSTPSIQANFTITCTRGVATDPTSLNYTVTVNNGDNNNGQNNFARLTGSTSKISYETYTTGCATLWKNSTTISGTVSWTTTGNATDTRTFWLCVNSPQTLTAQGAYVDSVTMTAAYNGTQTISGEIPVTFYAPAFCNIASAPANIALTYPSFSTSAVAQNTTFATLCTTALPYTLAISPVSGTIVGVGYQLTVAAAGGAGSPSCTGAQCNVTGTGASQPFTVTATAPPGQPGTCATGTCTGTQVHTLTITY
jgi:hypothetical protein